MTKRLSLIISYLCLFTLVTLPLAAIWLLFNLDLLAEIAQRNIRLPIIWETVENWQLLTLWLVSAAYISIGLLGIFYLRRSFLNFSKGQYFNIANTRDLRRFSICILIQGMVTPVYYSCLSVLLSWQHPPGQKMLSIMFGSNEIRTIGLALIFWVVSNLLVEAEKLKNENQQFI